MNLRPFKLERFFAVNLPFEWVNFYDRDDVIGFPLKSLNREYRQMVSRDEQVSVGGWLSGQTPLSHIAYWTDREIVEPISERLLDLWRLVDSGSLKLEYPA